MTQTAVRFLRDGDKNPLLSNRELSIPQAFTDMVNRAALFWRRERGRGLRNPSESRDLALPTPFPPPRPGSDPTPSSRAEAAPGPPNPGAAPLPRSVPGFDAVGAANVAAARLQ